MREIILDTETTGLDPYEGHRIVEIGCVELVNRIPTGRTWHCHLNPERDMPQKAYEIHGLSTDFLRDKPRFGERADELMAFIEGAMLVMHNATFDFGFLNAELERLSAHAAALGAYRRHAGACEAQASGRAGEPRCAVPALWRRSHRARELGPWRSARLPAAGVGLCGAGRRQSGAARIRRQRRCGPPSCKPRPIDRAAAGAASVTAERGGDGGPSAPSSRAWARAPCGGAISEPASVGNF